MIGKPEIYANFARYSYAIPLDMAIRSLSNEQDAYNNFWAPPSTGAFDGTNPNIAVNPDGTLINPTFTDATELSDFFISSQSGEAIASGTKMQYLQEWVYGFSRELPHGVVVDVRWQDRRLKRIVEDMAGLSPEGADAGEVQQYVIGNPNASTDLFTNEQETSWLEGAARPASCDTADFEADDLTDASGNPLGSACFFGLNGGQPGPDGKADGLLTQHVFTKAWKSKSPRASAVAGSGARITAGPNCWATMKAAFRNDNAQSDPSISSLFDFTTGNLACWATSSPSAL